MTLHIDGIYDATREANSEAYWNGLYTGKYTFRPLNDEQLAIIADAIPPQASVLDVGCGVGFFLEFLSRTRKDLTLYGIDHAEKGIEQAREIVADAVLRQENVYDLNHISVHTVTALEVLEHLLHPIRGLSRIFNTATHKVIVAVPNDYPDKPITFSEHANRFNEESLRELMSLFSDKVSTLYSSTRIIMEALL